MGFMDKMRSSTPVVLWVLIFSFGILFMLQDTDFFSAIMVGPTGMGSVNGVAIDQNEYNQRLSYLTEQHRSQTGEAPSMEQRAQYEKLVWDQMVLDIVLEQKMDELGIIVTDSELREMVLGPQPDPMVAQLFMREDGTIDRAALNAAVQATEATNEWIYLEGQLRERRSREKLNAYLQSSMVVSTAEVEQEFIRENSTATFRYVRFPYSDMSLDDIEVSSSEIRNFYRDNQKRFERKKSIRFRYVSFDKTPTGEDTVRVQQELAALRTEFAEADNDSLFLLYNNSESTFFGDYLSPSELRREFFSLYDLEDGEVGEVFTQEGRATLLKRIESRRAPEPYVRVSQIQLRFTADNKDDVRRRAGEIVEQARGGEDFAGLARLHSADTRSAQRGGDLGYLARGDRPAAITTPIFNASSGAVVGPVEEGNSFYIFRTGDRNNTEIRYAALTRSVYADPTMTVGAQERLADDFAAYSNLDGFEDEAERNNYIVQEAFATEDNPVIPGFGQSQNLLNEIRHMRTEQISDVIELDDRFIVLKVDEVTEAGVAPLDEVSDQITSILRNEKRKTAVLNQVKDLVSGAASLDAFAEAGEHQIRDANNVRMSSATVPGAGREPQVVGAVFGAPLQTLAGPVAGETAVYLIEVTSRTMATAEQITPADRASIRSRLEQEKGSVFGEVWVQQLRDRANVKDYRGRMVAR
ncbi:MAG: SurA N-terminal domain-containing protein [Cyclonatronaceae bacterium]